MAEKSKAELLKEKLFHETVNGYDKLNEAQIKEAYDFSEGYKDFLDRSKTEREAVAYAVAYLEKNGFTEYEFGRAYKPGDGVYLNNRGKSVIGIRFGAEGIANGVNIVAAHIDSPRIDLKQRPLYEASGLGLFKTHYYGGIRKYQWPTIPLALHGVICKTDGTKADICIGENDDDPVFCITDLLPHLAKDQAEKKLAEAIPGEGLNIVVGSRAYPDEKATERVKLAILEILNEKYGITEADFLSAELSAVPAFKARDIGIDRSMVGGYGHDDRVCAYPALAALADAANPERTAILILADKEEIGSMGNTSMQSRVFTDLLSDIADVQGASYKSALSYSRCLSADVNACFDPNFPEVNDAKNAAYINKGVVVTKYTGSRGKAGSSDANAEYAAEIRALLDERGIIWQTGELGKVDQGGGGTVAGYLANMNIEVIDVGVPVLSMHSPFEVVSKLDVFMLFLASQAFYN